ncbi:hypothetical protein UFOVP158_13 [uncultured Caudovirales phage]|uniref:Terminase n=1 Tax=uncultured Caudovirales phage TaxID=2100421 RepID=A0A6J7WDA0_9CAUD|nr:hypothetical protein UFOVP158_13 [uncultured Caudovirales phage]
MAKPSPTYSAADEQSLMSFLWSPEVADSPLNFVLAVYPWGVPGSPLAGVKGPRKWQIEVLKEIEEYLRDAKLHNQMHNVWPDMFRMAIASGRGIGKSALLSWIAHWHLTCVIGSSTWCMANGEPQLKTKTFPEISKWVSMGIHSHWFIRDATRIYPADWLSEVVERDLKIDAAYWYIAAQLWSEENPDAAAGAHNVYGELAIMDEASGIAANIWTVWAGVFTEPTPHRYWIAFSNPRRNSGAFYEAFHKSRNLWRGRKIDARSVEGIPPSTYQVIIDTHGIDSDEVRIEVLGEFPSAGARQFISSTTVLDAQARDVAPDQGAPLILGVDVARYGEDSSVIAFRQGRDAKSIPWQKFRGLSTTQLASRVAEAIDKYKPDAVFIDGNGVGGGVVDQLLSAGYRVSEVQFGGSADDSGAFHRKRDEIWHRMREWLAIGTIPGTSELFDDLIGPEYEYGMTDNKLKIEAKDKMKARGVASPDAAEALAMTFAKSVARKHGKLSASRNRGIAKGVDYGILG